MEQANGHATRQIIGPLAVLGTYQAWPDRSTGECTRMASHVQLAVADGEFSLRRLRHCLAGRVVM